MKHFVVIFMWFVFGAVLSRSLPDHEPTDQVRQPTSAADVLAVVGAMGELPAADSDGVEELPAKVNDTTETDTDTETLEPGPDQVPGSAILLPPSRE